MSGRLEQRFHTSSFNKLSIEFCSGFHKTERHPICLCFYLFFKKLESLKNCSPLYGNSCLQTIKKTTFWHVNTPCSHRYVILFPPTSNKSWKDMTWLECCCLLSLLVNICSKEKQLDESWNCYQWDQLIGQTCTKSMYFN